MGKEKKNAESLSQKEEQERIESLILAEKPEEVEDVLQVKDKKIKNIISAVILLAGLFVGSLFVDTVQLFRGGGFSQRALDKTDVFSSNGKTWVAYTDPIVTIQVINDDTCGDPCKPDEVLVGLKQAVPTMLTQKIDANSEQGKKIIAQFSIKTLPAFVFSKEIEKTQLFSNAQPFLNRQGESYAIKSAEAGFPVGKYISAPTIDDSDIKIGSNEAKVKVIEFSDLANSVDAVAYKTIISQIIKNYGDSVQVILKNYFPPTSQASLRAALASQCANEQGKFLPYAEKLYSSQTAWNKLKDATSMLKLYAAQTGLKAADFNKCLDDKKYQDQIAKLANEGQSFGISSTPSVFVGSDLQVPTAKYDDIKKVIDAQLAK